MGQDLTDCCPSKPPPPEGLRNETRGDPSFRSSPIPPRGFRRARRRNPPPPADTKDILAAKPKLKPQKKANSGFFFRFFIFLIFAKIKNHQQKKSQLWLFLSVFYIFAAKPKLNPTKGFGYFGCEAKIKPHQKKKPRNFFYFALPPLFIPP